MPEPDKKKYKGFRGTIKAALDHHPDKFSKEACKKGNKTGKLCPYAIFTKKKEEGETAHYKEQPKTTSGIPKKKAEFKNESFLTFREYLERKESEVCQTCGHSIKDHEKNSKKCGCKNPNCDCGDFTDKNKIGSLNANIDLP